MPEGPTIRILKEQAAPFVGRKVLAVSGNAKIPIDRLRNKKIVGMRTWGKQLLIDFGSFTLRIHLLLFGSYSINEARDRPARLSLTFTNGSLHFYACAVTFLEGELDGHYDWSVDVMDDAWDPKAARRKLKAKPDTMVCDAMLDQTIFAGSGNIFRNEVLYRLKIHPKSLLGALPPRKLTALVREVREYAFDFYEWKKAGVLKKHWQAHTKRTCPRCRIPLVKEYMGVQHRRTFYCNRCQVKYT